MLLRDCKKLVSHRPLLNKWFFSFTEDPFLTVEAKGLAAELRGSFFSGRAHHLRELIDVSIVIVNLYLHL